MADAIMNWDASQSRWRKTYKKVALQVRASELGGTNYADTVVAANQWFRDQKARIDREQAVETLRPNEAEYRAELESIQADIKPLTALVRNPAYSNLVPVLEILRQKKTLLEKALQKPTLLPLDDSLRNPRHLPPARLGEEATEDAKLYLLGRGYPVLSPDESREVKVIDGKEYLVRRVAVGNSETREVMLDLEEVIDTKLKQAIQSKDRMLDWKKREAGVVISDREQGKLDQLLEEQGVQVPESRLLDYHIAKFIAYQQRRHKEGKISAGRLGKITNTIGTYQKWSSLVSVTKVGTKEHIDAYYASLSDKVIAGEIKPGYANDIFGTFKMLVDWLVDEGALSACPPCLQRKSDKYTFPVERQKPKTVALDMVKKILDAAGSRLKLCMEGFKEELKDYSFVPVMDIDGLTDMTTLIKKSGQPNLSSANSDMLKAAVVAIQCCCDPKLMDTRAQKEAFGNSAYSNASDLKKELGFAAGRK